MKIHQKKNPKTVEQIRREHGKEYLDSYISEFKDVMRDGVMEVTESEAYLPKEKKSHRNILLRLRGVSLNQRRQFLPLTVYFRSVRNSASNLIHNGFVYVIKSDDCLFKIGQTTWIQSRFIDWHTLPIRLDLAFVLFTRDYEKLEKQIHKKFAAFRTRGEWFCFGRKQQIELMSYLESLV